MTPRRLGYAIAGDGIVPLLRGKTGPAGARDRHCRTYMTSKLEPSLKSEHLERTPSRLHRTYGLVEVPETLSSIK